MDKLRNLLAAYRCAACGATGAKVYRTVGRIRYVTCSTCGAPGKVVF